jgi:hypothetical protein
MTGINQGTPEAAIGEPIRLGSNNEFEIEQHPASDRLIIRDTQNGRVAYVRKERGGSIGGDGILVKALKEGKPMADDGHTYDTIQQAEREADSWMFIPPGTYNESVFVHTDGLTIKGSGYNTHITNGYSDGFFLRALNVTIKDLSVSTTATSNNRDAFRPDSASTGFSIQNCAVREADRSAVYSNVSGEVIGCTIESTGSSVITSAGSSGFNTIDFIGNKIESSSGIGFIGESKECHDSIVANNVIRNTSADGIDITGDANIIIGNRVINAGEDGLRVTGNENIVANNRVSDSTNQDTRDNGTGNLLDANLTGVSN